MESFGPYRNRLTVLSGLANKHGDALPARERATTPVRPARS